MLFAVPRAEDEHDEHEADRVIRYCRTIGAPAATIFAILADPSRHPELDGSGLIRGLSDPSAARLTLGAEFEMRMQQGGAPYRTTNRVVEFDEPHLIAWQVHPAGPLSGLRERLVGGHRWRYRLTEEDGRTTVCEEWDYTAARSPWVLRLLRFPARNQAAIPRTLDRLADLATQGPTADRPA